MKDTIAAVATPVGSAGIGIIRISGEDAFKIADDIFLPKNMLKWKKRISHLLYLGNIIDKEKDIILDEALVTCMKAPNSFTGEDVVEINSHGGFLVQRMILELIFKKGIRPAEAGEFSKRAFLNGKMDLVQAESIIDIIQANNDKGLEVAVEQLHGSLSDEIRNINQNLLKVLATLEALIDFPEDEIEGMSRESITVTAKSDLQRIISLIDSYHKGKIFRDGIKTVIAGKPNVGKSSLLNALLRENRAIVTDIPGTTRDIIEEYANLGGLSLKLLDTAGVRNTEDAVEKIGVDLAYSSIDSADVVLFLMDASRDITDEDREIEKYIKEKNKKYIRIWNKADLIGNDGKKANELYISAKECLGIEELEEKIKELLAINGVKDISRGTITRYRHYELLLRSKAHLEAFLKDMDSGLPEDFLTIDLKSAWEALGEITGDTATEDIFDKIFAEFCIGK